MASELTAAKRLKDLEKENSRLKRLLADAKLDSGVSGSRIGKLLSLFIAAANGPAR